MNYDDQTTVAGFFHNELINNGLFPAQATEVMDSVSTDELGEVLREILSKKIEGYPEQVKTVAWLTIKRLALKWIDENKPQHWARGIFA